MSARGDTGWDGADSARRLAKLLFREPGDVVEIRVLGGRGTTSGYFDNEDAFVAAAERADRTDRSASGSYVTCNPVRSELIARANNRLAERAKTTTNDSEIVRRRWLLVDLDAERPSGISASEEEKRAAFDRAKEVTAFLEALGFTPPAKADSGNGAHLLYPVDFPADDDGLISSVLEALGFRFDDERVVVDTSVSNPARIVRLYGTVARKGDSTDNRPHRRSHLFEVPDEFVPVPEDALRRVAALAPPPAREAVRVDWDQQGSVNVDSYLASHSIDVSRCKPWRGGRVWVLDRCVWNPEHDDGAAYVVQFPNGAVAAGCHHNGCTGRDWRALREALEPDCQKGQKGASVSSGSAPPARLEEWPEPEPVPDELPPVLPFDPDLLPGALRPRVEDIAERFQCPIEFVAAGVMVSAAGLIGRRVGIRPKARDPWLVVPNLFGMVVGRPGVMKSPAVAAAFAPLKALEREAKAEFDLNAKEFAAKEVLEAAQRKVRSKQIEKAIKDGGDALRLAREEVEGAGSPPTRTRYLINDSTVEKLAELLAENPMGLTVFRDELIGFIRSMEHEGQEQARAFYLEGWNGDQSSTVDRIGRGTMDVPSNTLSVFGCIQPGPLRSYMLGTLRQGAGDDGFLQRFQVAVYPDFSKRWTYVDRPANESAESMTTEVYQRLSKITRDIVGAEGADGEIPYLRFDQEAQAIFRDWLSELEHRLRRDDESPVIEAHLSKYRSLVPSLALVIHLVDAGEGPVAVEALRRAIQWVELLESHARRIFHSALNHEEVAAKLLSKKVLSGALKGGFVLRDVYRKKWSGLTDRGVVQDAVNVLQDLGWLYAEEQQSGGRPKTVYRINPRVLQTPGVGSDKSDRSPSEGLAEGSVDEGACGPRPQENDEEAA